MGEVKVGGMDRHRKNNGPQRGQVLSLRACEYVSLCGKRHFADVIKVMNLEMGRYPGLSGVEAL